jgi:uncharacterized damage-inducible protein DinB
MDAHHLLTDAFDRIEQAVEAAIAGLDDDGLTFRPDVDANSIGWLVWHLTRVQDDHVSEIAGIPQTYVEDGWAERLGLVPDVLDTGYGHTSEQVAAVRFERPDEVLAYHRAVAARTRAYLATVTSTELDRIIDRRWDPPVTVGVRLVSVISDDLQHAGQANYVRGLYERRG